MTFERRSVGVPATYKGSTIAVQFLGPDYLCKVDGQEVGQYYITPEAALKAGERFIDEKEKEAKR